MGLSALFYETWYGAGQARSLSSSFTRRRGVHECVCFTRHEWPYYCPLFPSVRPSPHAQSNLNARWKRLSTNPTMLLAAPPTQTVNRPPPLALASCLVILQNADILPASKTYDLKSTATSPPSKDILCRRWL